MPVFDTASVNMGKILYQKGMQDSLQTFLRDDGIKLTLGLDGMHLLAVKLDGHGAVPFSSIASLGANALYLFFFLQLFASRLTFLFIDDFDMFLHYDTARLLTEMFGESKDFQSVVVDSNTALMNNRLTRPDGCYIVRNGEIEPLCKRTEAEIREAHNLVKIH